MNLSISMKMVRRVASLALAGLSFSGDAAVFKFGDGIDGKLGATLTAGTTIRTESPDPDVLGILPTARLGMAPGQLGGSLRDSGG